MNWKRLLSRFFERELIVEIHLPKEAEKVEGIARHRGIDSADLIHEWVSEKSGSL